MIKEPTLYVYEALRTSLSAHVKPVAYNSATGEVDIMIDNLHFTLKIEPRQT